MVRFWVGFALIVATLASLSHCETFAGATPFDFRFNFGSGSNQRGSGIAKSESRELAEFTGIHAEGAGTLDVEVRRGLSSRTITLSTDDNLLSQISTEVVDGILEVSPLVSISPIFGMKLKVAVPSLSNIHLEGANDLNLTIDSPDDFTLHIEGAGKIKANGRVGRLTVHSEGAGSIDAANLVATDVDVHIEGAGKARVNVTGTLKAHIEGAGLVTYAGEPKTVEKIIEGIGRIRKAD